MLGLDLTDEQLLWICDETGLARVDVMRVIKTFAEVEDQALSERRDARLDPSTYSGEIIGSFLRGNAFMRSLSAR